MKIKVTENLTSLINHINECENLSSWFELVQFSIDYGMYEDLYKNHFILQHLMDEHDTQIRNKTWKKPGEF